MAHEVESMAYRNDAPWHGFGYPVGEVVDPNEMARLAGCGFNVYKSPIRCATHMEFNQKGQRIWSKFDQDVEGFFTLRRDTDGRVLDVVGSRYKVTQPIQAFEFFTEFTEAGDAEMETAGSLRGGKYVWGLANLKTGFTLPGKDTVKGYILVCCPFEQGKALIIRVVQIRVVCMNTLAAAISGRGVPEFRMAHRSHFDSFMIKKAKIALGLARENVQEFEETARALKKMKVTNEQAIRLIAGVMAPTAGKDKITEFVEDPDSMTPRLVQVMNAYRGAPGADPGTGWGVLNAVTYYADHLASRTSDQRLTNAWFGKTARQKIAIVNELLEKAA